MSKSKKEILIENYPDNEFLVLDGLDSAIIGASFEDADNPRVVYCRNIIIELLVKDNMEEEDAMEHYEYNIAGGYLGPQTPIFIELVE